MGRLRAVGYLGSVLALSALTAGGVVGSPATARAEPAAPTAPLAAAARAALPGPFVSILFSRTEMNAAVDCTPDGARTGIARLGTTVAPYLRSLGMAASGTLVTGRIRATTEVCTHQSSSLMGSWADAVQLAQTYGWHFVSHTATYPPSLSTLTPQQAYAETCGSAMEIDAHGLLGGHGLIAYPGAQPLPVALQSTDGAHCFAWGRRYSSLATTDISAGTTAPYWQRTAAPSGGACNDPKAACFGISASGGKRYVLPSVQLANLAALQPGQWMTLQAFILVTGKSPAGSTQQWDCRAANPTDHWTTDNERYCYTDWQRIVSAVAARPDVTVTDPLTVGIAFGRPATYAFPPPIGQTLVADRGR
jgi:hypothetical protein